MLTDTHCHLNFDSFDLDRPEVVERARQAGVERILNPGIDLQTSRTALDLAERWPELYAAVGIHPNDSSDQPHEWIGQLRQLAAHPRVVAIGEIGLDDYWDRTPIAVQRERFELQLELAAEVGLPVVVHCRDKHPPAGPALEAVIERLLGWQAGLAACGSRLANRPGVLHSYSGDLIHAKKAAAAGFMIGITGPVTFKKAEVLRQVVSELPETMLLVETDSPFLAPHPHRGKRNEPAYIRHVVGKIAEIRQVEAESLTCQLSANAERLFAWEGIRPHE